MNGTVFLTLAGSETVSSDVSLCAPHQLILDQGKDLNEFFQLIKKE
jgi:hypothetical protein